MRDMNYEFWVLVWANYTLPEQMHLTNLCDDMEPPDSVYGTVPVEEILDEDDFGVIEGEWCEEWEWDGEGWS